jgi:hypothetical protein
LWLAFFLPGPLGRGTEAGARKERRRGEDGAWQGGARDSLSTVAPGTAWPEL